MSEPVTRENPPLEEDDKNSVDELDDTPTADSAEAGTSAVPAKRGRGRPKGSKNKKTLGIAAPAVPAVPKKRGRPPKEKKDDGVEPPPKRPRGRPPKNPKPALEEGAEPPVKRKRGRPPKNPQPAPAS